MKRLSFQYTFIVLTIVGGVLSAFGAGVALAYILYSSNILFIVPLTFGAFIAWQFLHMASYYFIREA